MTRHLNAQYVHAGLPGEKTDRFIGLIGAQIFHEMMREHGVEAVRMVATSAARDVANRDAFFAMTAEVLGAVVPGAVAEVIRALQGVG